MNNCVMFRLDSLLKEKALISLIINYKRNFSLNHLKTRSDLGLLSIKKVFQLYGLLLCILLLARVFFVLYFGGKDLILENLSDVLYAFFMGWKYDNMAITYMLTPVYFLLILMSFIKNYFLYNVAIFLSKLYGLILLIFIPMVLVSDLAFYSYFQDHINILFFGLFEDDTVAVFKTMWSNYPIVYISLGILLYLFISGFFLGRTLRPIEKKGSLLHGSFLQFCIPFVLMLGLIIGGARGGYGVLVLAPKYADFSQNEFINQIPINGFIALEKSIKIRRSRNNSEYSVINEMGYENRLGQAFSDFLGFSIAPTRPQHLMNLLKRKTPKIDQVLHKKPHVVVLLMESFGGHWSQYQGPEFNFLGNLESHFKEDIYFNNFISSHNGTIGSLLTLTTNIPPIPGKRFLSESKYMQIPLETAAHIPYKKSGYETLFVYGGKLGWRDIGKYMRYQKYDQIIGENKIKESLKLASESKVGTEWGVYDEHFFDYIYSQIKNSTVPKMILGLSTSNHPPFDIPDDFKGEEMTLPEALKNKISREEDLFMKRLRAFQYANFKLSEFISKIKNSDIGDHTIIAVTGDHNFWGFLNYDQKETFLKYTVPFYIYAPKSLSVSDYDSKKLGSHEDIFSTIYNISLSEVEYLSFGEDLFSESESYAINSDLQASQEGLLYKGVPYKWKEVPWVKEKVSEKDLNLTPLRKRYRSSMAISDFYLESLFKAQK